MNLKLSAPKNVTWGVAVILGFLSVLGYFGMVAALSSYSFELAIAGLVVLVAATLLRGL